MDVRTDSGDTICPPTENGGGIKTCMSLDHKLVSFLFFFYHIKLELSEDLTIALLQLYQRRNTYSVEIF